MESPFRRGVFCNCKLSFVIFGACILVILGTKQKKLAINVK